MRFRYDNVGQLTVARATNSGGSITSGETKGYLYDAAWNLNKRTNSNGASTTTFSVNTKNELTSVGGTSYTYDNNANVTLENGARNFVYDAENQLTRASYTGGYWQQDFVYDGRGRLRKRIDYSWTGSSFYPSSETRYVYDGMRMIQERSGSDTPTVGYTRGSDLSGSFEGAGGIGGLLARSHSLVSGSFTNNNYYHADGGGNVTCMVNTNQANVATYKYDPERGQSPRIAYSLVDLTKRGGQARGMARKLRVHVTNSFLIVFFPALRS